MTIEQIFYAITTTVTILLTVLTLQRLLSGWWRHYYLLGLILVFGLAAVIPPVASWASNGNWKLSSAQRLYWIQALTAQGAMALLVLQLIYRVGRETPARAALIRLLTLGSVLVAAISVAVHFDKRPNTFMASVTRDLTFLSAILNMILWRFLMQVRKKDFLLLAVSAGLGIQCTGDAVGHSFRLLAKQVGSAQLIYDFGNILMSLSAVMTVAIWHTAFSRSKYPGNPKTGNTESDTANDVVAVSHRHPAG